MPKSTSTVKFLTPKHGGNSGKNNNQNHNNNNNNNVGNNSNKKQLQLPAFIVENLVIRQQIAIRKWQISSTNNDAAAAAITNGMDFLLMAQECQTQGFPDNHKVLLQPTIWIGNMAATNGYDPSC